MPANFNVLYTQQFASAVELIAQQKRSRIASTFTQESVEGKSATVVDFVGSIELDERTTLYDDIIPKDVDHFRPYVYPRHFDGAIFFDDIEKMQANANPQSAYLQDEVAAMYRAQDREAIRAFFDTRTLDMASGSQQSQAFNFGNNRVVDVNVGGATSGLNVQKLQKLKVLMKQSEVGMDDDELIHIAISPVEESQLMDEIEVTSSDFTRKSILDAGTIVGSMFMGFDFIVTNQLPTDANGYRRLPAWTTRGMSFATWDGGTHTDVSQRKDKRGHPWQVYIKGSFGAVRRDENRVYEIKANEA